LDRIALVNDLGVLFDPRSFTRVILSMVNKARGALDFKRI